MSFAAGRSPPLTTLPTSAGTRSCLGPTNICTISTASCCRARPTTSVPSFSQSAFTMRKIDDRTARRTSGSSHRICGPPASSSSASCASARGTCRSRSGTSWRIQVPIARVVSSTRRLRSFARYARRSTRGARSSASACRYAPRSRNSARTRWRTGSRSALATSGSSRSSQPTRSFFAIGVLCYATPSRRATRMRLLTRLREACHSKSGSNMRRSFGRRLRPLWTFRTGCSSARCATYSTRSKHFTTTRT
mmetsp:Transcript_48373/g.149285  ORF Transcript_48373/g.149285 Transcript_48373/m.149285 type:complete len:250 (+) Transcript_48373:2024-2773(+)